MQMAPVYDFDITSIEFLLFNNESGACSRLNKLTVNDSGGMSDEFGLIDRIICSADFELEHDFINIAEKFIDWGSGFVLKMIQNNMHHNYASKIMSHLEHIYELLPKNSQYFKKTFLNKVEVMNIFRQMEQNFNNSPRNYLELYSKIWILCETEIKDNDVFSTALNIIYELLKCTNCNDLIIDIFNCAEKMLSLHVSKIKDKISEKIVINALLNILKVVVRTEQHAFARLNFWWKFICALNAQVVCSVLFTPCVIPFLANLFGKYLSFDLDEKFQYSLYTYNCFNYYEELGSLCNHAMTQILRLVGEPYLSQMEKTSKYDTIKHWRPFTDILLVRPNTSALFISFYYWCQTAKLNKAKSAPTPFHILETVFKSFSGRFLKACLIKQRNLCLNESNDDNVTPFLYEIISQALCIKRRLETDLKNFDRDVPTSFNEHMRLMKAITDSLRVLGDNTSCIPSGLKLMLRVLNEHLNDMGEFGIVGEPSLKWCGAWLDISIRLIDRVFPKNSLAFTLLMYDDVAAINKHWFEAWLQRNRTSSTSENSGIGPHCAVTSLQCWYYLTVKLCPRLDKESFTHYSSTDCHLVPFAEYLVLPVFLLTQLDPDVLTADDYQGLWKLWEHIYIDLVSKAQLLGSSASQQWSHAMLKGLRPILKTVRTKFGSSTESSVLLMFNFICRCLRLVVLRADDCVEADTWTRSLHALLVDLSSFLGEFSPDRVRLEFDDRNTDSDSSSVSDKPDVLVDLVAVPAGNLKWSKTRMGYVSRFQCNLDSNLDTFLSLLNVVIYKLVHDEATMLKILNLISDKLAPLTVALVSNKKPDLNQSIDLSSKYSRSRIAYDENISQLENFLSHFLTRIQTTCLKKNLSTEAVAALCPVLVYIFSTESCTLSRSTIQFAVQIWNDIVQTSEEKGVVIVYPDELVRVVTQMKVQNKAIEIPESMQPHLAQVEIPAEFVHQDSFELGTATKPVPVGSILHKIQSKSATPTKPASSTIKTLETKSPIVNTTPTKTTKSETSKTSHNQLLLINSPIKSPLLSVTDNKSSIINTTPIKTSTIDIILTKSPMVHTTPIKSPRIHNTPTKSPRIHNTPTKSPIVITTPTKLPMVTMTPTKSPIINTTPDKLSLLNKGLPVKEFSSPGLEIPKKVNRKRSFFDLTRKCSDADYVVIAPQNSQKRARLTEHQKECFEENRNQYKPPISMDGVIELPTVGLYHQDSVASSSDTVLLPAVSDSTDIDQLDDVFENVIDTINADNDRVDQQDSISIALSSDSDESDQQQLELANENKENFDEVKEVLENKRDLETDVSDIGNKQAPGEVLAQSPEPDLGNLTTKDDSNNVTKVVRDKFPFVDLNKNNAVRPSTQSGHGPVIRLSTGRLIPAPFSSPLRTNMGPNSGIRSPLVNRPFGLNGSPIGSTRSQRCVQMVLDSKKKEGVIKSPLKSSVTNKGKQTGIIRHMLSERKKDMRVSFSNPIETELNGDKISKVQNEDLYISPIPSRSKDFCSIVPDQLCISLKNTLVHDDLQCGSATISLLDQTERSLCEINEISPIKAPDESHTFETSLQQMKNIFSNEIDKSKKKVMIKTLLDFAMSELNDYLD